MEPRVYRCTRFPHLSISRGSGLSSVEFSNGRFIAETEAQRDAVERNEWFGTFITLDTATPEPAAASTPDEIEYRAALDEITGASAESAVKPTIGSRIREHFREKKK